MTVPTTNITSGPYTGNGLSDEYDYDFKITDESELTVYETDDSGTRTELVLNTDYTVTGVGVTGGGTVVRTAGNLPTDYTWYIRSNFVPKQETSFASQGGFFPAVHEKAFDLLTYLVQQLIDRIGRSLRFSDGYSGSAVAVIPDPVANYYFRWNEDGTVLVADPGTGGFDANNKLYKRILRTYLTGTSSLALSVPADISVGDIVFVNSYSPSSDISPSSWSCVSLSASLPGGATTGVVNNASNGDLYLLNSGSNYYQFRQVSKNKNIIRGVSRLRETTGSPGADDVFVSFHTSAGDGGGGDFRWVSGASASTYIDNNGTIIVPTGGDGSAAWLREYSGDVFADWFGFSAAETASAVSSALQSAIDFVNASYLGGTYGGGAGNIDLPNGVFEHNGVTLKKGVNLKGRGQVNTILLLAADGATGINTPAKASQLAADVCSQSGISGIGLGISADLTPTTTTILLDTSGFTKCRFADIAVTVTHANVIGIANYGNTLAGSGGPAHWYNSWADVHVYVNGGTGILWGDNDSANGEQVTAQEWHGGSIKGLSGTGMHIRGGTGISFHGTTFENLNDGDDNTIVLGDSIGSRVTTSVNFHGCYFESARMVLNSNTNRCGRYGCFETGFTVTDSGSRNARFDFENRYTGYPRTYVSGRITTSGLVIHKSYNVGSISKIGTGVFRINFTTSMPDINYVAMGISESSDLTCRVSTKNQAYLQFYFFDAAGAAADPTSFSFLVIDNSTT